MMEPRYANVWAVVGPADEIVVGPMQVTTKAGKVKYEDIVLVSEPFERDGELLRLGYTAPGIR